MDIVTDKNTVTEIKSWLDSHGIEYPSNAQKADLLKLVPGEPQEDIDQAESEATIVGQSEATSSVADSASSASDSSSMASSSAAVDVQPAQPDSSSSAVQPEAPVESAPVDPQPVTPEVPVTPTEPEAPARSYDWASIFMPKLVETAPVPETRPENTYTVQDGDTLASIANNFHMSVGNLKRLNGLMSNVLFIGRVLKIK
ncbi:LysM peptidoglycan-binding domain-containing protein [Weissella confusa]|uniref:LysM peptidoglycan-binding domain-containing protein n=1 Tax=Weissella confusa TaxID=1583 RepID=UPI0018F17789|nr:LysM peptidoglycan-binding domain-containing protein [Weissella confusa]MBJ7684145.1 LysM peptidoglycan-binding domain-containing protein [Weissella confusa]MBJ7702949.1 LysM peptidoglycan-binding domain-containing protein [Weissella confusa]